MSISGYFDYNATTPVCAEATAAFMDAIDHFANPSSSYALSAATKRFLDDARQDLARLLGARAEEVNFCSGGTEANNWAIKGAFFRQLGRAAPRRHLIISAIEHASVEESCAFLQQAFGCELTRLKPDADGLVPAEAVARALRPDTALVSVMLANNEVGTVQPVRDIAALLRGRGIHFHVDGVQALGKMPVQVKELGVDTLSFSGHKFHAPKGIGGLYINSGVAISPLLHGGGQEKGLRGGTEAVALVAAMGAAARVAGASLDRELARVADLARQLRAELRQAVPGILFHGPADGQRRLSSTLSVCVPGIRAEALAALLDHGYGIQVSLGSACSNNKTAVLSHVLQAMGLDETAIQSTLRVSIGRYTSAADVQHFVSALAAGVAALSRLAKPMSTAHARSA